MRRLVALAAALLLAPACLAAQNRVIAEIPIELAHDKTIIPVSVGGATLRLILDTGMDYDGVLIFDSRKVDRSRFRLAEARIGGAGSGSPSSALVDTAAAFSVGPVRLEGQRVILLTSHSFWGFPTDGVIGYSLLGRYAVELDYERNRMVLYEPETFRPAAGWTSIDLYFQENRVPWLDIAVSTTGEEPVRLAAYIDFASSEAVELLERERNRFTLPASLVRRPAGRGLSGEIEGREGRLAAVWVGPFVLFDVTTLVIDEAERSKQHATADAIVGNGLLHRFNVVFDYAHRKLHLMPNRSFHEPF